MTSECIFIAENVIEPHAVPMKSQELFVPIEIPIAVAGDAHRVARLGIADRLQKVRRPSLNSENGKAEAIGAVAPQPGRAPPPSRPKARAGVLGLMVGVAVRVTMKRAKPSQPIGQSVRFWIDKKRQDRAQGFGNN